MAKERDHAMAITIVELKYRLNKTACDSDFTVRDCIQIAARRGYCTLPFIRVAVTSDLVTDTLLDFRIRTAQVVAKLG